MACLADFPPELTLEVFPHLCLKSLIAAEGVCQQWKQFISIADINPVRRALLELFKKTVNDPLFLPTRPWLLVELAGDKLTNEREKWDEQSESQEENDSEELHSDDYGEVKYRPFDEKARQAYIDALLSQRGDIHIPEDFCLSVYRSGRKDNIKKMSGCNFLGLKPPFVKILELGWVDGSGDSSVKGHSEYSDDSDSELDSASTDGLNYSEEVGDVPGLIGSQTFAVYVLANSQYDLGESTQYPSWISWLETQLKKIRLNSTFEKYGRKNGESFYDYEPGEWFKRRVTCVRNEQQRSLLENHTS
ncbi:hypothetical protein B0H10DRAFT_2227047 [Mycena sp. CBHHK59/15]|nr:hypothetical protein B0H10DRAFT_2227047 [Mycena sp. CBHHK59/15]